MKHPYELEPGLRYSLNSKKARRMSTKKHRKLYNRLFRRSSKNVLDFDTTLLKKRIDLEF